MRPKGLIAIDLDGTLLQEPFYISDSDLEALEKAASLGYLLALCTGRSIYTLLGKLAELRIKDVISIYCGCNGAEYYDIRDAGEVEILGGVTQAAVKEAIGILAGVAYGFVWYTEKLIYTTSDNPRLERVKTQMSLPYVFVDKEKISEEFPKKAAKAVFVLYEKEQYQLKELLDKHKKGDYDVVFSDPIILELIPKGINKGSAFREICKRNDIDPENTMAIGDHDNDLPMLQSSCFGVAMGNAVELLKKEANYITGTLEANGVAEAIEVFLNRQKEKEAKCTKE